MSAQNNGGAAFPQEVHYIAPNGQTGSHGPCGGMTLRDYFAAKALSTIAAYPSVDVSNWEPYDFARHAYQIADAMIAERAK